MSTVSFCPKFTYFRRVASLCPPQAGITDFFCNFPLPSVPMMTVREVFDIDYELSFKPGPHHFILEIPISLDNDGTVCLQ
jgi:hypothetical protein